MIVRFIPLAWVEQAATARMVCVAYLTQIERRVTLDRRVPNLKKAA